VRLPGGRIITSSKRSRAIRKARGETWDFGWTQIVDEQKFGVFLMIFV
jgi:hypothetical protein